MKKLPLAAVGALVLAVGIVGTAALTWRVRSIAAQMAPAAAPGENSAGALKLGDSAPAVTLQQFEGGGEVTLASLSAPGRILVVTFHHPDCPCAANCGLMIAEMMKTKSAENVDIVGIQSADTTSERVRTALAEQRRDGGITFPVYMDPDRAAQKAFGAIRTPETWVFDTTGKLVFWGAPENTLFPGSPGHRFLLKEAVDAIKAGRSPEITRYPPIGCLIE